MSVIKTRPVAARRSTYLVIPPQGTQPCTASCCHFAFTTTFSLSACAVSGAPGPSVMALPGQEPAQSFEAFQQDDIACRQYGWQQTGGASPDVAASQSAVSSAALGTALGAGAGAAISSVTGAAGAGAAIGERHRVYVAGSAIGANNATTAYGGVQQLYDVSYTQCMYAHGNTVQAPPLVYASYPLLPTLTSLSVRLPGLLRPCQSTGPVPCHCSFGGGWGLGDIAGTAVAGTAVAGTVVAGTAVAGIIETQPRLSSWFRGMAGVALRR